MVGKSRRKDSPQRRRGPREEGNTEGHGEHAEHGKTEERKEDFSWKLFHNLLPAWTDGSVMKQLLPILRGLRVDSPSYG